MTWTGYLKIAICVGLLAVGFGSAWKIQGLRLDVCKKNEAVYLTANAENTLTIAAQKAEIEKLNKSCSARIESKDQTIRKLKQIDELVPGGATDDDKKMDADSSDPILGELGRMFKPDKKD